MADSTRLAPTITLENAISREWDVLVVGGGPAGAVAARETALQGARVLLVDRGQFPRAKVCGCCLNASAWQLLEHMGLGELPCLTTAPLVTEIRVGCRGRSAILPLEHGLAVSRERLDTDLIRAAIDAGAAFLDGTRATVQHVAGGGRQVHLRCDAAKGHALARVVVVAAGLGGRNFADPAAEQQTTTASARIGVAAMLDAADGEFPPGRITMACDRDAYVGIVRLEGGRLDIAAAVDAGALGHEGRVADVVAHTLDASGLPTPRHLASARWIGTPKLTHRRKKVAGERYVVIGDAAAYVEPFTGEGIAWALASGHAVAPIAFLAASTTSSQDACAAWSRTYRKLLGQRMRRCRVISLGLRHPMLVRAAVGLLSRRPGLAAPLIRSLTARFAASHVP